MGENDQAAGSEQGGVFGNLPRSRPGIRSPRRASASRRVDAGAEPPAEAEPPADPETEWPVEPPRAGAGEAPPTVSAPAGAEDAHKAEPDRSSGGLEDLAWAGVAAAAEAATIGVRLASRAMEAVRDSVERR